jgi:hypothetical protein
VSARTSTNSASPPARSRVSGEVACSRVMFGSARFAACLPATPPLVFGLVFGFWASRRFCGSRLTRAAGAGDGCGAGVSTGGGGVTTTGWGEVAAGGGGGGGGGETRVVARSAGWGLAPGTGSGSGVRVFGGAGSGSGAAAYAGSARHVPAQHTRRNMDACRNNDRAEPVMNALPQLGTTAGPSRFGSACQWRGGRDRSRVAQIQHARKTTYATPSPSAIRHMSCRSPSSEFGG